MNAKMFLAKVSFACFSLLWLMSSCGVDKSYDVSKDFDMTIGLGKGLSLPIGSTEKIMLSEFIDPESTEVLTVDEAGNYSITASGSFKPESFIVNDVDIELASSCSDTHYDFALNNISQNEDIDKLPEEMQEQIKNQKYPYVVYNDVDYTSIFDINQAVPEEMKSLAKMTFKKPVEMELRLKIKSEDAESDELLCKTNELMLLSETEEGFVVEVPEFLVFSDKNIKDGKLILKGSAKYDISEKSLIYKEKYFITGLDFTGLKDGFLAVNDGKIELKEELEARGYVESDVVYFDYDDQENIAAIDVICEMVFGTMEIADIEGKFSPEIAPVKEVIDLDFSADMDFLKNAYMDVHDPCIYVTFTNPIAGDILVNTCFIGLDDNGEEIEDSHIDAELCLAGGVTSNILIDMYGHEVEGYTNCVVDNLNGLLKHLPNSVEIDLNAHIDTEKTSSITLGEEMELYGEYEVSVPLAFDSLRLEYTYSIDDVFGDMSILENVKDINALSITFDVYNTLPVEFDAEIFAYDADEEPLADVQLYIEGAIKNGKGAVDGEVGNPVKSSIKVTLEAHNGHLKDLSGIDIKLLGTGVGAFNANEYLQLKDIHVNIDDYITLDLNNK